MNLTIGDAFKLLETYYASPDSDDFWGIQDYGGYLYRPGGNVTVEGELFFPPSVTLPWNAKMGVMYRESTANNSAFICIVKLFDGTIAVLSRATTGASTNMLTNIVGPSINRFKLDNSNSTQKLYYHNGMDWTLFYTANQLFTSAAKIGFCFALKGSTGICSVKNVVYKNTDTPVVNKPTNLTMKVVQIASTATAQSGGQTNNKPANLTMKTVQIRSAGDAAVVLPSSPSTGFQVYSFHNKNGMSYIQTGTQNTMKITVNTGAGTITDEYYSWKPTSTCYVKWKIDSGPWHGTYPGGDSVALTNYSIPTALRNMPLTITKYFVEPADLYRPIKYPLQQIIRFN